MKHWIILVEDICKYHTTVYEYLFILHTKNRINTVNGNIVHATNWITCVHYWLQTTIAFRNYCFIRSLINVFHNIIDHKRLDILLCAITTLRSHINVVFYKVVSQYTHMKILMQVFFVKSMAIRSL